NAKGPEANLGALPVIAAYTSAITAASARSLRPTPPQSPRLRRPPYRDGPRPGRRPGSAVAAGVALGAAAAVGEDLADVGVQPVAADRLLQRLRLDLALTGQPGQHREDDRGRVHVEVPAGGGAGVGEAEPVGAERGEVPVDPGCDLVRYGAGEVGHRDDRAGDVLQPAGHVRDALLALGVQQVPLVAGARLAGQLVPRGRRPHVGRDAPVLGEEPLRLQDP